MKHWLGARCHTRVEHPPGGAGDIKPIEQVYIASSRRGFSISDRRSQPAADSDTNPERLILYGESVLCRGDGVQ
jgi:hypothetical protein